MGWGKENQGIFCILYAAPEMNASLPLTLLYDSLGSARHCQYPNHIPSASPLQNMQINGFWLQAFAILSEDSLTVQMWNRPEELES